MTVAHPPLTRPVSPPVVLPVRTMPAVRPWERWTPVRRLPAQVKIVGAVALALAVVAVPAAVWPVHGLAAALLVGVGAVARVPVRWALRRSLVEAPFVAFALLMPFVATGPRVGVGPLELSIAGLQGGGLVLARGTLGLGAAILLVATTPAHEIIEGFGRLRLPRTLVAVLTHMIRFLGIVTGDLHRQEVARLARGDRRGVAGRMAATAASAGHLFVRCYERGERQHLAMIARGASGIARGASGIARGASGIAFSTAAAPARACDWLLALAPALLVVAATVALLGGVRP